MQVVDQLRDAAEWFAFELPITTQLTYLIATLLAVLLAKAWVARRRMERMLQGIPSPPGSLPFFGHAFQLAKSAPWDTFHRWIKTYGNPANGRLVQLSFVGQTGLIVSDPQHFRYVFDKHQRNFAKDVELSYKPFLHILGTGLVTSTGESWKRQRALVGPAFRRDILEETAGVAKRAVDRLSLRLEAKRGKGEPVELAEEFRVMTLQVIGELILSLSPEESARVFPELYLPIVTEANRRVWEWWRPYMPTPEHLRFKRTVGRLNEYVSNLIRERWAEHRRGKMQAEPDVLDRILSTIDPSDWGEHWVRQLRDEIKTFLLAGHETSASMLTWSIYELSRNPEVLAKLLAEGRSVFNKGSRVAGARGAAEFEGVVLPPRAELERLEYTVNTLKESLRRYTLVPVVSRVCVEDDMLGDQPVPAGTKIFMLIKAVHMNPDLWPDPDAFRPERFEKEFEMYNFNAFLNGPRNCLGSHLALLEARIVLSLLSQRFTFTPVDEKSGEVDEFTVPTCPKNGMWVYIN